MKKWLTWEVSGTRSQLNLVMREITCCHRVRPSLLQQKNLKEFEERRAELERNAAEVLATAQARAEQLAALKLEIAHQAGEEGKLFGSVTGAEISKCITDAGVGVAKSEIRLPNGPLRELGDHEVAIHLHTDVTTHVTISVVAEE